ncbi:methylated-DNA--[protein]-cysteine S-methyltransferase [Methanosarcina sp. KYL-1]|uniref:methylated-DNA--[protein]-cysteine S-methyltransferase n=1 Tax=Methanosarcina sp. KYL-1 TaxID=2602068 RepID=UPI0021010E13|nr:methylated-DNA--[protein]-cysteine S-methyltransferase [Methanosarcina sp. KYL-1]MCQ1534133.1 methylated-DNA--[protein]-cysteine S-methyltransferase [Methanosarcina sp. KYL-1]
MYYHIVESPIGPILLAGDEEGLKYVNIRKGKKKVEVPDSWEENKEFFRDVSRQLGAYFAGKLESFNVKLASEGTEFQKSVWKALREIPYGETRTYGQVAKSVGNPKASRAVGLANNRNPVAIIVPCHRVIGANGKLTGYASGLDVKEFLLRLEGNKL